MGCSSSAPEAPPPDPPAENDPCTFIVKKPMMSSTYQVMTEEKVKWLQIQNDSSFFSSKSEFTVKSLTDDNLVNVTVEGQDIDLKKSVEWEGDSDDSDFSVDDLFDFDDDEVKVKLKWKIKREAKFVDKDGNQFADLSVKVKGKSKCEIKDRDNEPDKVDSSSKVKKVYYKLNMQGAETAIEVDNGHWQDWDRQWTCDAFDCQYDAKFGTDEVKVSTKGTCNGSNALAIGFALGYFFHPSAYNEKMDSKAKSEARSKMGPG